MTSDRYAAFVHRVRRLYAARAVEALLDWDQETCMPPRGAEDRAVQVSLMAGISHNMLLSEELREDLEHLEREQPADGVDARTNVREIRRQVDRAMKLPRPLVEEIAHVTTLAKDAWSRARRASDFDLFAPHLRRIVELKREVADRVGWTAEPYDALMDEFEPGARAADVAALFESVKPHLVRLVQGIANAPRRPNLAMLECPFDAGALGEFCRQIAVAFGYDFEAGRLDVSAHPFCTGLSPRDVRITTRYTEKLVTNPIFSVMHEVGHALYEQGFDVRHTHTPLAAAASLGIHESQSRLWENIIGRSRPFWERYLPALKTRVPALSGVTLDEWHLAVNDVRPSFIRVDADEVTYNLHVMLRFDLERRLIRGELAVQDVPEAWNGAMRELLGVIPPTAADGCLQDIHWSMGAIGYFPTYALGNLYAAQFAGAARAALPRLDEDVRRGEFRPLREWLRENIHRHGQSYRAGELVKRVTGRELSPTAFIDMLREKFEPLYGLR